jgi:uncharacterized protein (TIGR03435 family)
MPRATSRASDFLLRIFSCLVIAQTAPASYDVASIKPNHSGAMGEQIRFFPPSARVTMTNITVKRLIQNAYQLQDSQIAGGPGWISSEHFDIVANAEGVTNPTPPERWRMMRALLAERFKLKVHTESRELSTFALVLARADGKLGGQLRKFEGECVPPTGPRTEAPDPSRPQPCGTLMAGPGRMNFRAVTMEALAQNLSSRVGRAVVDRTGLTGRFDLDVEFAPQPLRSDGSDPSLGDRPSSDAPSIYTALAEQLGLKLESQKRSVDVTVIDSVERPTEG